jgi:hypothetical protein
MRGLFAILAFAGLCGCASPSGESELKALKVELSDKPLRVTFTNSGKGPIRILQPLDGSESCATMPYYRLSVVDEGGKEVPLASRCGMGIGQPYWHTKWPEDYLVTIPAEGSYSVELRNCHAIPTTASYTVRFTYVFKPDTKWYPPDGRCPRRLWRGEVTSNAISARLEAVKPASSSL